MRLVSLIQGLGGAQSETTGDGSKFVAAANAICAETGGKDAPYRRHEGGSSGKKDTVNFSRIDPRGLQQGIDATLDCLKVVAYPGFELRTLDGNAQVDIGKVLVIAKTELGNLAARQLEFDVLN